MVAFGSASQAASSSNSFSISVPSSTASGDLIIAFIASSTDGLSISGGASWTVLTQDQDFNESIPYYVAWKIAGGSEGSNYTVSQDMGDCSAHVIRVTNASTDTPVFAVTASQSGTSISTPSVTPDGTTDLLIRVAFIDGDSPSGSWTPPASHTERTDIASLFIAGTTATRQLASGGATGAASFTNNVDGAGAVGITVAITDGAAPQTITGTGIASAEAFGTAKVNLKITCTGIASGEAFGDTVITTPEEQFIDPSGIASEEAFGTPTAGLFISPSGIASEEAFGDARLAALIGPTGIASAEAFGSANVAIEQFISPSAIATGEAFGTLVLQLGYPQTIVTEGIASAEIVDDGLTIRNLSRLVLVNPSIQETPAAWDALNIRYGIDRGITIMKDAEGVWSSVRYPAQTTIEEAERVYMGGRRHTLTVAERDELIAAGFGAYITLELDT